MSRKRNVNYIKPEDPEFLKVLKRQAGYDDKNHKFDELKNAEGDFVDDDDSEQPQVVVLKDGDLTAEQAEIEKERIEKEEAETKADLSKRVIFKPKESLLTEPASKKRREAVSISKESNKKKHHQLLSFGDDDYDDDNDDDSNET